MPRKFIENFAKIAIPLNKLLRKNEKFNWSQECQDSFETLKQSLLTSTILQYPDFTKEFTLTHPIMHVVQYYLKIIMVLNYLLLLLVDPLQKVKLIRQ